MPLISPPAQTNAVPEIRVTSASGLQAVPLYRPVQPPANPIFSPSRPPTVPKSRGRRLIFGWNVTIKWLSDYGLAYMNNFPPYPRPYNTLELTSTGLLRLRRIYGIDNLFPSFADRAAETETPLDVIREVEETIPILAIVSSGRNSFCLRPTKEKVDKLSAVFEQEPRWWIELEN